MPELQDGFTGFDPKEFEIACDGCGKPINTLSNFLRAAIQVERVIPHFQPENFNGATSSKYTGRDEGGVFHNHECLVKKVTADASEIHPDGVPRLMLTEEVEFPYGENEDQYQQDSEDHNTEIRPQLLKQVRETVGAKK